jgi:protein TonB
MLAFALALATHIAVYLYSTILPGSDPVYRGGGTFDQDGELSESAAGVFVQLGKAGEGSGEAPGPAAPAEQAPVEAARESMAQGFVAGDADPGSGAKDAKPETPPEPVGEQVTERTEVPPAKEEGPAPAEVADAVEPESETIAPPAPRRKPKRAPPLPEMETLGRRLSVQGPEAKTPRAPPAKPAASTQQAAKPTQSVPAQPGPAQPASPGGTPGGGGGATGKPATDSLAFASRSAGTAGGNRSGEIRELNYEDRVLLWIKRHGSYPYEAAMYNLEGTVTMKFAINRQGEILYYELVKKSKWQLLNRAVRRMMDRSSPVPPIPVEIAKNELTFTVPVHFTLIDRP